MNFKYVLNRSSGQFGLSMMAVLRLRELGHPGAKAVLIGGYESYLQDADRLDPRLVQVVEELGPAANGERANLQVEQLEVGLQVLPNGGLEVALFATFEL
jgi:hypothetical protein